MTTSRFPLRPYQCDLYDDIHSAWDDGAQNVVAVLPTGGGKCLGRGTPVMMYDGSVVPVEEVTPGDLLMGPDSQPRRVVSTCTGREMLYRVTPTKGDPYVVNESHILSLRAGRRVYNLNVLTVLNLTDITLRQLKGWRVPGVLCGDLTPELCDITVEPVGVGDYFGFELSGPDRLFLLGDFTVTHNTRVIAEVVKNHDGPVIVQAHRGELVSQIAMALAREEIPHSFIAAKPTIRFATSEQQTELGRSYYHPNASVIVSSTQTLIRRQVMPWERDPRLLWITDEAHHVRTSNQWGQVVARWPQARGLGVTATPWRADGAGLGRHADGVFDWLVEGPTVRELIDMGHLTDYDVYEARASVDLSHVLISATTGDYNQEQLRATMRESRIVGDVVDHYLAVAPGKLAVVFTVDVEESQQIADALNAAGIRALSLSAKNTDQERADGVRAFRNREIEVLVNCDLFGEGFDLPAVEVVILARPTMSYSLYIQQIGRGLRPSPGKERAIIIDMVGNIRRFVQLGFGLPDTPQNWSLDRRERKSKGASDALGMTICVNVPDCGWQYPRGLAACPFCGHTPATAPRGGPERVEGDIYKLTPKELAEMAAAIGRVRESPEELARRMRFAGAPEVAVRGATARHRERLQAQERLDAAISWFGGWMRHQGHDDAEGYRRFWQAFGTDVLTARTLGRREADELAERVEGVLIESGALIK